MATIISRNVSLPTIKRQYRQIVGNNPRPKTEQQTYENYKNLLVNLMLEQPNTKLKYGERISKNKPTDRTGERTGRPRTTGRERVCEIVKRGTNTTRLAEQNYECKKQARPRPVEAKEEKEFKQDFISIEELQNLAEDGLRRIITALIPIRQRNKTILQERYNARRGVLNDLTRPQLLDLLRQNNLTEISSDDAVRILRYRGKT
jgi:hypothetical protein